MKARRLFVALCASLASLAGVHAQEPVGRIAVEIRGPQSRGLCLSGSHVETLLQLKLDAGEARQIEVPFVGSPRPELMQQLPEFRGTPAPSGVSLVRASQEMPPPWSQLPYGLQSRALPPVEASRTKPEPLRLALVVAAMLVIVGLRRRRAVACFVGAAAAGGMFLLPKQLEARTVVTVLEADGASGRTLEVRGAREQLLLPARALGWARFLPPTSEVRIEPANSRGEEPWALKAKDASLYFMREVASVPPRRADSGVHEFAQAWSRDESGAWSAHGPWARGTALPAIRESSVAPPGWLASGLPQGLEILVGELEGPAGESRWLRLVAFQ